MPAPLNIGLLRHQRDAPLADAERLRRTNAVLRRAIGNIATGALREGGHAALVDALTTIAMLAQLADACTTDHSDPAQHIREAVAHLEVAADEADTDEAREAALYAAGQARMAQRIISLNAREKALGIVVERARKGVCSDAGT